MEGTHIDTETLATDEQIEYHLTWQTMGVYICPRGISSHRGKLSACGRQCRNAQGDEERTYEDEQILTAASRYSTLSGDFEGGQADNRGNRRRIFDDGDHVAAQREYYDEVDGDQERLQALRTQMEEHRDWRSVTVLRSGGKMQDERCRVSGIARQE